MNYRQRALEFYGFESERDLDYWGEALTKSRVYDLEKLLEEQDKDESSPARKLLRELLCWLQHPQFSTWPYVEGIQLHEDIDSYSKKIIEVLGEEDV